MAAFSETEAKNAGHTGTVLYVDDSPEDRQLMELAFQTLDGRLHLHSVDSGPAAIAYFQSLPERGESAQNPSLVLLDLKMTGMSGFEVLQWMRHHPSTGDIPVAIFSSSAAESDVERCYQLGADFYLIKPNAWERMLTLVKTVERCHSSHPPNLKLLRSLPECKGSEANAVS